jgi:hypothetical protein
MFDTFQNYNRMIKYEVKFGIWYMCFRIANSLVVLTNNYFSLMISIPVQITPTILELTCQWKLYIFIIRVKFILLSPSLVQVQITF